MDDKNDANLQWLVGYLEGEGAFMRPHPSKPNHPVLSLMTTDADVCARVAGMFGVRYHKCNPKKPHHKPAFRLAIRGRTAVLWMQRLLPFMGIRRKKQIQAAISSYKEYSRCAVDADTVRIIRTSKRPPSTICQEYKISPATYYRIRSATGVYSMSPSSSTA